MLRWTFTELPELPNLGGRMLNPDEVRTAFNRQHPRHGGAQWVRLDLSAGPVLARRNVAHHSAPIYVAVVNADMARHHIVTLKRQLKSNGSSSITPELREAWVRLIGYTEQEYEAAKASDQQVQFTLDRIRLYEQGPSK